MAAGAAASRWRTIRSNGPLFFLLGLNAVKVILLPRVPLSGDEAYYWVWSRHLALGYVDHPPLIAYVNYLIDLVAPASLTALRVAALLLVILITGVVYLAAREMFARRSAVTSAILVNLLPAFLLGGFLLVPATLLCLFWALAFFLLIRIQRTGRAAYWYLLGVVLGLGLLSEYVMVLLVAGAALSLIVDGQGRRWLRRPEPYLALAIALVIIAPTVYWQWAHHFPILTYRGGRVASFAGGNLVTFLALQMAMVTPPLFLRAVGGLWTRSLDLGRILTGVVLLPFALVAPFMDVGGHWLIPAYLPAIVESSRLTRRWHVAITGSALVIALLGVGYYAVLHPDPQETAGRGQEGQDVNRALPEYLQSLGRPHIYASTLGLAALVTFYGHRPVYLAAGRHAQYDIWGRPDLRAGDDLVYFALNERTLPARLTPLFRSVTIERGSRLVALDAGITDATEIIICRGYVGSGQIP